MERRTPLTSLVSVCVSLERERERQTRTSCQDRCEDIIVRIPPFFLSFHRERQGAPPRYGLSPATSGSPLPPTARPCPRARRDQEPIHTHAAWHLTGRSHDQAATCQVCHHVTFPMSHRSFRIGVRISYVAMVKLIFFYFAILIAQIAHIWKC